jgi:hypothetical protein
MKVDLSNIPDNDAIDDLSKLIKSKEKVKTKKN